MIQVDSFQGHKNGSTYANQSMWYTKITKGKRKTDHCNRCRKGIWENSTSIHDKKKILTKMGRGNTSQHNKHNLNTIKPIYNKLRGNIMFHSEKLKAFLLNSGIRQGCPLLLILFKIVLESPSHSNKIRKRKKRYPNWKVRCKTVTICKWHETLYREP